jgi:uncharacterized protein YkvS
MNIKKSKYFWWYNFVRPQRNLNFLSPYQFLIKKVNDNPGIVDKAILDKIEEYKILGKKNIININILQIRA